MAKKNGYKITIATAVAVMAIVTALGRVVWVQATQTAKLVEVCGNVAEIKPKVDANAANDHSQDLAIQDLRSDLKYLTERAREQKVDTDNNTILLERILLEVTE